MFIFFVALNIWLAFTAQLDLHLRHVCMYACFDERFSETGREINKDIFASQKPSQITIVREDCQIGCANCFSPLKMPIL